MANEYRRLLRLRILSIQHGLARRYRQDYANRYANADQALCVAQYESVHLAARHHASLPAMRLPSPYQQG